VRTGSRIASAQDFTPPTKKPRETAWGAYGVVLSREERGLLRHGRVAWLTALQPITVAGPRPIRTAFPASLACKNER
jgi:hypothetical protein